MQTASARSNHPDRQPGAAGAAVSRFACGLGTPIRHRRTSVAESQCRHRTIADGQMGFLDRSRRHLHRRDRAPAGRHAGRPQAAVGESGGLSRRRRAGHPRSPRPRGRASRSRRADRRRQDGHHGRHQCAARAQGRADAAAHHQGLSRRAQDRLPGAAEDLRPAHRQAGDALRARGRGRRARARRRHGRARARPRRGARRARARAKADGITAVAIVFMHAYRYPRARAAGRGARARHRLPAGLGQPRGLAADQAGRPRRHDGGRCLSVADPAPLCGAGGGGDAQRQPSSGASGSADAIR